uniref:Apolipoprotein M n=1 Tax=Amphilophus citrinellus TaxID=61819 RepID=A0A3Q0T0R2_AMPCI
MFLHYCLPLLTLFLLSGASDPGCEELIKPVEDKSKLSGKWIFHFGTSDSVEQLKEFKTLQSYWAEQSPIPDSNDIFVRYADKIDGKCYHGNITATFLGNSTKAAYHFNSSDHEHIGEYLATCPDCLLWTDNYVSWVKGETRKSRSFFFYTKNGTLDASHLEVLKKQAACLNFTLDFHFTNTIDLCPDEKEAAADARQEEQ